jgi:hypothetical protein
MPSSNNPTSVSATVGNRLRFQRGSGPRGIAKALIMPAILAAFATYLVYGIVVMKVPPSAAFPGPQFFPGIIAVGLSAFAIILGIQAVRAALVTPSVEEEEAGERLGRGLVPRVRVPARHPGLDHRRRPAVHGHRPRVRPAQGAVRPPGRADHQLAQLHRLRHGVGSVPALRNPRMGLLTWTFSFSSATDSPVP